MTRGGGDGKVNESGKDGRQGLGAGGGGGGGSPPSRARGNGGSGTVVIRYNDSSSETARATGGAISFYNGKTSLHLHNQALLLC